MTSNIIEKRSMYYNCQYLIYYLTQ